MKSLKVGSKERYAIMYDILSKIVLRAGRLSQTLDNLVKGCTCRRNPLPVQKKKLYVFNEVLPIGTGPEKYLKGFLFALCL